jgi:hypothetical protein
LPSVLTLTKNGAYCLGMRNRLIIITFITGLLVTGCGSNLEEKLKLIEYENCLDVQGTSYQSALNQGYGVDNDLDGNKDTAADYAQRVCDQYKP